MRKNFVKLGIFSLIAVIFLVGAFSTTLAEETEEISIVSGPLKIEVVRSSLTVEQEKSYGLRFYVRNIGSSPYDGSGDRKIYVLDGGGLVSISTSTSISTIVPNERTFFNINFNTKSVDIGTHTIKIRIGPNEFSIPIQVSGESLAIPTTSLVTPAPTTSPPTTTQAPTSAPPTTTHPPTTTPPPKLTSTTPSSTSTTNTKTSTTTVPPVNLDSDGDGLTDEQESQLKTNPYQKDTDGDGIIDSKDPNPLVSEEPSSSISIPIEYLTVGGIILVVLLIARSVLNRGKRPKDSKEESKNTK